MYIYYTLTFIVNDIDMEKFDTILKDVCNKSFGEIKKYKADEVFTDPLIFTNFMELAGDKAENRGPTFVFSAQLKSKSPPGRWVLAGVGLIFDVAG